ncbi:MAG TPA: DNA polymerase III subunit gamma/tau, partial [Solirubrobacteraceae bacterium]|nr:DNA polymerase III subunit gamma/tau [Solirubrobacteraceae bacterium]
SRGTGKTSMAKILAACLNCEHGPTVEPCGRCESCRAIAAATSLDVIEMDAASNNSVDDIRELRESVAFAPVSGRSKVYILDEAHMLSQAAWNAFLKTLEEPPPNTVFVLATTEAQKVPATVVDRCHRFDFQRPTVEQIAGVVRRAADAEGIELAPEVAAAVARAATGSFRDALGTLEQLLAYSDGPIALEDALAVLGVTDARLLEETIDAVHAGDARAALLAVARCAEGGRDAGAFAADLEARARDLLVVGTLGEVPAELSATADADASLRAQAERVGQSTAVRLLEQLGGALEAVKAGGEPRTQLELALVKAARPDTEGSLPALLARIERLEGRLSDGEGGGEGGSARSADAPAAGASAPIDEVVGDGAAVTHPADALLVGAVTEQPPEPPPAPSEEPPPAPTEEPELVEDVDDLDTLWPAVMELVGAENKLLSAVLADSRAVALRGEELIVAFAASASFLKKKAEDNAHRATVGEALRTLTGRRLRVAYELREELPPPLGSAAELVPRTEEEWVARFKEELDAEELDAEELDEAGEESHDASAAEEPPAEGAARLVNAGEG